MLWHVITAQLGVLTEPARLELETKIARLDEIDEIRWFRSARDVERPGNTAFIAVLVDRAALERYRVHPIHLDLAQALRDNHVVVHRLDLDELPMPA
jgi:hypothetical protein